MGTSGSGSIERIREIGFELRPQPDGSLEVRKRELEAPERRQPVVMVLGWNLIALPFVAVAFGFMPGNWEVTEAFPGVGKICSGLFGLAGLSGLFHLIWTTFGREEWTVASNRIEVRQRLFGVPCRRVHTGTDLELARVTDNYWALYSANGNRRRVLTYGSGSPQKLGALFDLTELLAGRTGWRVRAPERPPETLAPGQAMVAPSRAETPAPPVSLLPLALPSELRVPVERELDPGEQLLWVGRPDARRAGLQMAPILLFGVPWTLFALFGMSGWRFRLEFTLFQSVFVFAGLAMCSTPLVAYYKAQRTTYAITDRRVLIVVTGRKREVQSYAAAEVNAIERQESADESGDLTFARRREKDSDGRDRTVDVKFIGIPKVREVERLLRSVFAGGVG